MQPKNPLKKFLNYINPRQLYPIIFKLYSFPKQLIKIGKIKIRHRILILFKVQVYIESLKQRAQFWQQEHKNSLVEIEDYKDELIELQHKQELAELTLNNVKIEFSDIKNQYQITTAQLDQIKAENQQLKAAKVNEHTALNKELHYQQWQNELNKETIRTLAQAQTDLFFLGNLQALQGWPLISIVLPVHNQAQNIRKTVQSVIDQIYPYWELLIIDDGSTDKTKTVIQDFFHDKRIHYYFKEHSGFNEARNIGLAKCQGELIAYLNAPKYWANYVLSVVVNKFLCENNCKAVYFATIKSNQTISFSENIVFDSDGSGIDFNSFIHHRSLYDKLNNVAGDLRFLDDYQLARLYQQQTPLQRLNMLGTWAI